MKRLVDSWVGEGSILVGDQTYRVEYDVSLLEDVISYRAGGAEKSLAGTREIEGHLFVIDSVPESFQSSTAMLVTREGHRIGIVFPNLSTQGRVQFFGNGAPNLTNALEE